MWTLIGVTGYTLPEIMALTHPQFTFLLRGEGPILFPRLRPQLDASFANYSSVVPEGKKENDYQRIIREDRERQARAGQKAPPTREEQEREQAYAIVYRYYLGPREDQAATTPTLQGKPLARMPAETARAVIAFASAGKFPSEVFAADLAPIWLDLQATAAQG